MAPPKPIIHLTATNHFPIKLSATNFSVWRKQIQSTLIGLEIDDYLTSDPPPKTDPAYANWYRQDQILFFAILGSCSDFIQPIIASAPTTKEAWNRLTTSFASTSRSRIISLKSKLAKNPKGSRPITEFLHEMRSIADELALAQSPINEEDLLVYILSQLGDEYNPITAALKVREQPVTYPELYDKLVDFERSLHEKDPTAPLIATANFSQRQSGRPQSRSSADFSNRSSRSQSFTPQRGRRPPHAQPSFSNRPNRNNLFCQFCNNSGHDTRV